MESIELVDIGPIPELRIPVRPGVIVLRGLNDCGKSLALDAVSRLAGGKAPITCRDKAASGSVEGLGVKISVRQSARRSGEMECLSIEGKLSIADLVAPPIKDPVAADKHRIKALLQLAGVEADLGRFASIFDGPEEIRDHVSLLAANATDLVEMAARIKRDMESASRKEGEEAKKAEARALACRQAFEEVDLDAPSDANGLQAALEEALKELNTLQEKAKAAEAAKARARDAQQRLERADAEASGPSVQQALSAYEAAEDQQQRAWAEVRKLETELAEAKQRANQASAQAKAAAAAHAGAVERAKLLTGWKETIEAASQVEEVPHEAIAAAQESVARARESIEQGAIVRRANEKAAEAEEHRHEARLRQRAADSLREAARATDDVLSEAVASESLTVRNGRLVTMHPDRGEVFYSERSEGTRWKLAIDEAIKRIRQLGAEQTAIIPVPQGAWSELDPANKAAIHEYAVAKGVTIITAEATDGKLRAETFESDD